MNAAAWRAAADLHDEAHEDRREPFVFCHADTCITLKDALNPDWRYWRPTV